MEAYLVELECVDIVSFEMHFSFWYFPLLVCFSRLVYFQFQYVILDIIFLSFSCAALPRPPVQLFES